MSDIWAFLLQTLTASGAAALLLVVKAMFRDKLSPRWQFGVWGILAVVLLLPAGWGGRYVLFDWSLFVEVLRTVCSGDFSAVTQVIAPIPLPSLAPPQTAADWLYLVYVAGVLLLLARYGAAYVRLRLALKRGRPAQAGRVREVAERYGLPVCPSVEVDGLPSAFICGVFRPVLVLPAEAETDEKVILHELLHLKYHDAAWGLVIAFFRCVHWCDPLIWLCADWAGNDLESLCDQRVLERLEGEERRDYGRILLSMADERYARTPGTSSMANGGNNIRRRIEAIARFKRYPAGMALASVCVAVVLAVPLIVGVRASAVRDSSADYWLVDRAVANFTSARRVGCSTYAGAFDAYAKAVLTCNANYRAMCAPLSEQNALAEECRDEQGRLYNGAGLWDPGLPVETIVQSGYRIYNLTQTEDGAWEGLLVVQLPKLERFGEGGITLLAIQPLRAERQGDRWVILPQGEFRTELSDNASLGTFPSGDDLPSKVYEAQAGDFTVRARWQTMATLCQQVETNADLIPRPHGTFDYAAMGQDVTVVYTGDPADKGKYTHIALFSAPVYGDEARPTPEREIPRSVQAEMGEFGADVELWASGSSSSGGSWGNCPLREGWEDEIWLSGGGSSFNWEKDGSRFPDWVAAELYLNGESAGLLDLLPVEGGAWLEH